MKIMRKALCLLLAGCLILAASCGKKGNDDNVDYGAGRYVENDITPPIDGTFMSFLSADKTIVCFDSGLKTRYESTDGGSSWSDSAGPGGNSDRYQSVQACSLLPDGSLLVFIQDEGLEIVAPDGSNRHYPVDEIDSAIAGGESVYVSLLQALDSKFLISYMIGGFMQTTRSAGPQGGNAGSGETRQAGGPGGGAGPVTQGGPAGGPQDASRGEPEGNRQGAPQGGVQGEQGDASQTNPAGEAPGDAEPSGEQSNNTTVTSGGPTGGQGQTSVTTRVGGSATSPMRAKTFLCDLSTGQIIAEISVESASAAVSDKNNFYLLDSAGSVSTYNLNDGTPSGKPEVRFTASLDMGGMGGMRGFSMRMGGGSGSTLALGNDGGLYAALDGSLLLAGTDGIVTTMLESTAYSIGAPRSNVNSVLALSDGSIVVNVLDNGQTNHLYRYAWNDNATINPDKTLTVWSLEDNNFVRAAISELRKAHPDSLITYEVALDRNSAVSASDAIKTLNTRLLGGNAPDVILLDGCSADSYASRGMLKDMSKMIDTSNVFGSLLDSYTGNGELYCLPTQFLMPMLMGSPEALADVKSLDDLVNAVVSGNDLPASGNGGPRQFSGVEEADRSALYFTDLKELCNILWISCAPDIVRDNQLNSDALRRYLETIKAISDKYNMAEEPTGGGGGGRGMRIAFSDGGAATTLSGSLMWYTMQLTHYAAFSAGNLQLLQMMMDRVDSTLELFPGLTEGAWQPSTVVGISADAKNQDFAAMLVQAMLSVAVQQLNYGTGLPVTRAGLDAQVAAINERRAENGEEPFSFDPNTLVSRLSSPSMSDTVLTDMMWGSVERCCKGETDVEGAVREIEQNVKNYLAERS